MTQTAWNAPILFEPLYMERIWGGRRFEAEFGRKLPPRKRIGEAWEIVDRPDAQSVVREGALQGTSLHELWQSHRAEVFGQTPDAPRFPLLIKLLDARDKLSLQVHPPAHIAPKLGAEPKTEFWYVAKADPGAKIYAGLREATTAEEFRRCIAEGTVQDRIHSINVSQGDGVFLPAGRFHAIGAGNLLVEIQQNSDTTYRVYDWDRLDDIGRPRDLHIEQALQSIDFNDCQPELVKADGEVLLKNDLFEIERWKLTSSSRPVIRSGQFAIVCVLEGRARCLGTELAAGEFALVPATASDANILASGKSAAVLRITIPA